MESLLYSVFIEQSVPVCLLLCLTDHSAGLYHERSERISQRSRFSFDPVLSFIHRHSTFFWHDHRETWQEIGNARSRSYFALFSFGYLLVDSMWSLLAVRFLHGIWFSILTTVTVPVANEFIPESRKGEGMGYFVMSTNLGVVFGPLLALTVVQFTSFKVLFGLLAVIISIGLIFSFMLKITELAKPQATVVEKSKFSLHDIIEVKVLAVSFVALLTAFAYSSIMSFITPFSETKQLLAYTGIFFIVLRPQCCWYGLGWAKFTTVKDQVQLSILPLFSLRLA